MPCIVHAHPRVRDVRPRMFAMLTAHTGPATAARLAEPTPLLALLAGAYAERVAALWPAPHGAYLEMPAQRRHLTHLVLEFAPPGPELADALRYARADHVLRDTVWQMPPGFMKLMARLGELAWAPADYTQLIVLFEDENAALVLRQTPGGITPDKVRALAALAPALRAPAIVRHLAEQAHASLLDEAWRIIAQRRGPQAAAEAGARWARAADRARLFQMAAQDLTPQRFELAPFPVHPDLRRLGGVTALADAGRRFRNCLATYRDRAADGTIALYEWAGPPPAAVSLARDGLFGWRLEEARGVGNTVLDEGARTALIATLRSLGVRVGRSGRDMVELLQRVAGVTQIWIDEQETELTAFGL
jgi:hypothetical protein